MENIIELNKKLANLEDQIRDEIDQADGVIPDFVLDMMAEANKIAEKLRHAA